MMMNFLCETRKLGIFVIPFLLVPLLTKIYLFRILQLYALLETFEYLVRIRLRPTDHVRILFSCQTKILIVPRLSMSNSLRLANLFIKK